MFSIENDFLEVAFKASGAEMTRLYDKIASEERLWSGDPAYWGKQAPVLFPFVGSSLNGSYTYAGKTYTMGRHGFARDRVFEVIEQQSDSICFRLKADQATRLVYPFAFDFQITYALIESTLSTTYSVSNEGEGDMIFSVGGHPAFHADYLNTLCSLEFEIDEALQTIKLDPRTGLLKTTKEPIHLVERRLNLTADTFKEDALIFENLKSTWIKLIDETHTSSIKVSIDDFPTLGIWSADGPFVCIEPWQGTADYEQATGRLEDKPGTVTLASGGSFRSSYALSLEPRLG